MKNGRVFASEGHSEKMLKCGTLFKDNNEKDVDLLDACKFVCRVRYVCNGMELLFVYLEPKNVPGLVPEYPQGDTAQHKWYKGKR